MFRSFCTSLTKRAPRCRVVLHGQYRTYSPFTQTSVRLMTTTNVATAAEANEYEYDLLVVGAGSGGIACARRAVCSSLFLSLSLPLSLSPCPSLLSPTALTPTISLFIFFLLTSCTVHLSHSTYRPSMEPVLESLKAPRDLEVCIASSLSHSHLFTSSSFFFISLPSPPSNSHVQ